MKKIFICMCLLALALVSCSTRGVYFPTVPKISTADTFHKEMVRTFEIPAVQNYGLKDLTKQFFYDDSLRGENFMVPMEMDAIIYSAFADTAERYSWKTQRIVAYQIDTTLEYNGNEEDIRDHVLQEPVFKLTTPSGKEHAAKRLYAILNIIGNQRPTQPGNLECSSDTAIQQRVYSLGWFRLPNGFTVRLGVYCRYESSMQKFYWCFWLFEKEAGITDTKNTWYLTEQ